jgi:uncharacterized protein
MMVPALTGFALGIAASAHCAAMCGPLVLAIGGVSPHRSRLGRFVHALLHQCGRVLTYGALALPAGAAGEALAVHGFGRALAIVAAVLLLAAAAGSLRVTVAARAAATISRTISRLSGPLLRWSRTRPVAGPLATGALNALLPCGLVYGALTAAGGTGSTADAVLLMLGFGAGTSVVLLAIATGAAAVPPSLRLRLGAVGPIVLAVTAVILLARGVSPHQPHGSAPSTHHMHE